MKVLEDYLNLINEQPAETSTNALMSLAKYNGLKQTNEFKKRAYEQCRQLTGEESKSCKDDFKQRALNAMARAYQDQLRNCNKTNDPGECNKRIRDAANKFLEKAREIRT